jgi:hypothetical protein
MHVVLLLLLASSPLGIGPEAAAAAAVACPAAPSAERAQCICSQTDLGRDAWIADVGRSCRGALRCTTAARYRACNSGRKFDESAQRCVAAANVNCQQAALARVDATATCTGGPTPDGTCGAGRPGNYCCPGGLCCSLYGICGWTPDHCDVNNGCQVTAHCSRLAPPCQQQYMCSDCNRTLSRTAVAAAAAAAASESARWCINCECSLCLLLCSRWALATAQGC